jgi:hypothetical protein
MGRREIKYRVCRNARLNTWDKFKRQCETAEGHPLRIYFRDDCGDFFARSDLLKRHSEHPSAESLGIPPEKSRQEAQNDPGLAQRVHSKVGEMLGSR